MAQPVQPPQLDYAERPRGMTRRRAMRLVTLTVLLIAAVLGGAYRQEIVARFTMLYWQRQCMAYQPSTIHLHDPPPACLTEFAAFIPRLVWFSVPQGVSTYTGPTMLSPTHMLVPERRNPSGDRRLIIVQYQLFTFLDSALPLRAITIQPGTLFRNPVVVGPGDGAAVDPSTTAFSVWLDPEDESHFRIDFQSTNGPPSIDGWLYDDDIVRFGHGQRP